MSVCLSICKVVPNVKYDGTVFEKLPKEDRKDIESLPDEMFEEKFSDGNVHQILDLTTCKSISMTNGKNRYWKKLRKMELPHNQVHTATYTYNAVVLDQITYRQGWFLKNRFFKKKVTMYCTNKKTEMIAFMKRYFDFTDHEAVECYQTFVNVFQYGMLFSCNW